MSVAENGEPRPHVGREATEVAELSRIILFPHYGREGVVKPKIWTRAMSIAENGKPWPHSSLRDSWCQGFPLRAGHNAVERESNLKYGLVQ